MAYTEFTDKVKILIKAGDGGDGVGVSAEVHRFEDTFLIGVGVKNAPQCCF